MSKIDVEFFNVNNNQGSNFYYQVFKLIILMPFKVLTWLICPIISVQFKNFIIVGELVQSLNYAKYFSIIYIIIVI